MRPLTPLVALRAPLAACIAACIAGCTEPCAPPTSIERDVFTVFVNPVSWEIDQPEAFPADTSPANGEHTLQIVWPNNDVASAVTVVVDGQTFEGRGQWDDIECGALSIGFNGRYERDGDVHAFSAAALLTTWDRQIDGFLDWQSTWQSAEGAVGTYSAQAQIRSVQP